MYLERVNLNARRESRVTQVPNGTLVQFQADTTRCAIKLSWMNPTTVVAGDQSKMIVTGNGTSGSQVNFSPLNISAVQHKDEITVEVYGDLVTRAFTGQTNAGTDAQVIETFLR